MHRSVSRRLVVLAFVILTALPAAAAPRRDDSTPLKFFERIIERIVTVLEDIRGSVPAVVAPPPTP